MKKTFTILFMSLFVTVAGLNAQSLVDFETEVTVTPAFGATAAWIDNPVKTGANTTDKCLQIGRTSTNWWELVDVPISFTIPANQTKYVHIMVLYAEQPDFGVRFNTDGATNRRINDYVLVNQWQDLVMPITAGDAEIVVTQLRIGADIGDSRYSSGYILNNTDKFGLIDEIVVNDDQDPRSSVPTGVEAEFEGRNYVLTAANGVITFNREGVSAEPVAIYNSVGALVKTFIQSQFTYAVPLKGLYIVKIGNKTQKVVVY